jgi:pimeloyl-ACP methyl ester carboxylesterase
VDRPQHVSRLDGSLNSADYAGSPGTLPQRRCAGADDAVIEPAVPWPYLARLPNTGCAAAVVIPGIGHGPAWREIRPDLLQRQFGCR